MIHHSKALNAEITVGENHHDQTFSRETTSSQTLDLKHLEIIKFSNKRTCDISFERS